MIVKDEEEQPGRCLNRSPTWWTRSSWSIPARPIATAAWPPALVPGSIPSPGWTASPRPATNPCATPRGDWIFWLDGDERLDEENRQKLRAAGRLAGRERRLRDEGASCRPSRVGGGHRGRPGAAVPPPPEARWSYRVHEQSCRPCAARAGPAWSDIVIQHAGHEDAALRRRKLERDLRLLEWRTPSSPTTRSSCSTWARLPRAGPAGRGRALLASEPGTVQQYVTES